MPRTLYGVLTEAAWVAARPFVQWKRARGGREWSERLGDLPGVRAGAVWIHAASVGEVGAASPLVQSLAARGVRVLLTVLTPTGRGVAERLAGESVTVAFPPLDFGSPVRKALSRVAPSALVVVETELWPNLLLTAAAAGVPVCVVNGRLSERSVRRYRLPGFPLPELRASIALVACRSGTDMARYRSLGFPPERLEVVGDMKFDALAGPPPAEERDRLRHILGGPGTRVVVFGSVRPREERAVASAAAAVQREPGVRAVVAPRHLSRVRPVVEALSAAGVSVDAWSSLAGARPAGAVVLDTIGELGRLYSVADVAFVGGTLAPYGGHNPLEPAANGVPVLLGPHTKSCEEAARLLVSAGAAATVADGAELRDVLLALLGDRPRREAMGRSAVEAVDSQRGATGRVVRLLESRGVTGARSPAEAS